MRRLLALLTLAIPVPSLAGMAGDLGPVSLPQPVNIISTFTQTNPGYVSLSSGTNTMGINSEGSVSVVVKGFEESDNFFAADSGNINAAVAGSDNPILLLVNRSTSTVYVYLRQRLYGVETVNVQAGFRLFRDPTCSNFGSRFTPTDINKLGTPSKIEAYTLPTCSATGSKIDSVMIGQNNSPAIMEDASSIIFRPGTNALFTASPISNNRIVTISTKWVEK